MGIGNPIMVEFIIHSSLKNDFNQSGMIGNTKGLQSVVANATLCVPVTLIRD